MKHIVAAFLSSWEGGKQHNCSSKTSQDSFSQAVVSAVLEDFIQGLSKQQTDFSTSVPISQIVEDLASTFPRQSAFSCSYSTQYNTTCAEQCL